MRLSLVVAFLCSFASFAFSQTITLPEILVPSDTAAFAAKRAGAKVFKLLPRGMFDQDTSTYGDKDNPLGIRGGGAYYSFATELHSYNKMPQIELQKEYLNTGFYGLNYGLMKDLGAIELASVSTDLAEVNFLATYKPRNLIPEIREEQGKRGDYKANGYVYRARLPAIVGHTYVLRAIGYDEFDILVAFQPIAKLENGALEVLWKELKTFPVPKPWYSTDAEMLAKLNTVLSQERFAGIKGEVKDNVITVRGVPNDRIKHELSRELHNLRPVSVNYLAEIEP